MMAKSVESVFIFQEGSEGEPNVAAPTYDAIVVEQWTIIDVSGEIFLLPTVSRVLCSQPRAEGRFVLLSERLHNVFKRHASLNGTFT